jgi:hypothetical protein
MLNGRGAHGRYRHLARALFHILDVEHRNLSWPSSAVPADGAALAAALAYQFRRAAGPFHMFQVARLSEPLVGLSVPLFGSSVPYSDHQSLIRIISALIRSSVPLFRSSVFGSSLPFAPRPAPGARATNGRSVGCPSGRTRARQVLQDVVVFASSARSDAALLREVPALFLPHLLRTPPPARKRNKRRR